jgi:hypothetical protein
MMTVRTAVRFTLPETMSSKVLLVPLGYEGVQLEFDGLAASVLVYRHIDVFFDGFNDAGE